jgi:hypothetical protein
MMEEMSKDGHIGQAAMKADMDRKTGRRYVTAGKLPSEMKQPRWWRTRPDPFAEGWPAVAAMLAEMPGLEAQTVLDLLEAKQPGRYNETHLRTLQRPIHRWRAEHGPEREIWFTQAHRPGEAAQTDFTSTAELGVTIAGQVFLHLLCVTGAAVLELAVGDGVPVGVAGGATTRRAGGAVPTGAGAALPPDRPLDGGDAPDRP